MTAPKFCKTKIVATIGPSSWDVEILRDMVESGMDLARINASFADYEELKRVKSVVRSISPRISLILDTMGNKIRVAGFNNQKSIEKDDTLILLPPEITPSQDSEIQLTYSTLYKDVSRGARILIDDGNLELTVSDIKDKSVICTAQNSYKIAPGKTVNIPNQELSFPPLTPKDIQDIKYAVDLDYDFIALSFVQNSEVVKKAREILGDSNIKIISKIENQAGVDNFDEILAASDAIMIARGDLGVEIPFAEIPIIQKQLIYRCRVVGKPVIVATQMLESMKENKHATRAEVNDVANSIMDGTDAVMLSSETATGKYSIESVDTMNSIALTVENVLTPQMVYGHTQGEGDIDEICKNVFDLTRSINLDAILVVSEDSSILRSLSRHRPNVPIFEIAENIKKIRWDNLIRGVKSYYLREISQSRAVSIRNAVEVVFSYGELDFDDKIAIISGSSIKNGNSNIHLEIATVKDIIKN